MLTLSRLYGSTPGNVAPGAWMHHLGLMQTLQIGDAGLLNGIKADLNMSALTFQAVAAEHPTRYLLARDNRGWQVGLFSNPALYPTIYPTVINNGLTIDSSLAYKAFSYCINAANVIAADLIGRLTLNTEVLFFGHGLAAGIAAIVREKVRAAGFRASFLFQSSAHRVLTEQTVLGITLPAARFNRLDDPFSVCPPANTMQDWGVSPGPLEPLYALGEAYTGAGNFANNTRRLIGYVTDNDPVSWAERITDTDMQLAAAGYYLVRHWNGLSAAEQGESIEWMGIANASFGMNLTRKLS